MGKFIDLTGQTVGRLTIIKRIENVKWGNLQWLCQCDCGNIITVTTSSLNSGNTKGCKHITPLVVRFWNLVDSGRYGAIMPEHL